MTPLTQYILPLLADLFVILSPASWVNNIFWVNICTAAGQGSQMAADGVRVGGLLLPIDVVPGRATVIARRHTEVRANERVSQEPCTREGPRASSLPTTCPTR